MGRLFSDAPGAARPPLIMTTDLPPPKRARLPVVTPTPVFPVVGPHEAGVANAAFAEALCRARAQQEGEARRPRLVEAGSSSSLLSESTSSFDSLVSAARAGTSLVAPSRPARRGAATVTTKTGRWTKREDEQLRQTVAQFEGAPKDWKAIAKEAFNESRSDIQCLERWEKVLKLGLVKGPWTPEEDDIVRRAVEESTRETGGTADLCNWAEIAKLLPGRLTKQVRERWQNHLNPALVKSPWTEEEDYLLVSLQAVLGNRWNEIARAFQGRSENAIKNRWNSKQRRTLLDAQHLVPVKAPQPNVCRNVNFHKALVKATGNDPEINAAASILVNKVNKLADAVK